MINPMYLTEYEILAKMGIDVVDLYFTDSQIDGCDALSDCNPTITATIDKEVFGPMSRLIEFADMMCNNKNPEVQEMYGELLTAVLLANK